MKRQLLTLIACVLCLLLHAQPPSHQCYNKDELDHCQDSIALLNDKIAQSPSAELYSKRGYFKYACNDVKGALADCDTCIGLDSTYIKCYYSRSIYNWQLDHNREALQDALHCVKMDSTKSEYWAEVGDAYVEMKELAKAEKAYNKAIDLNPHNYTAYRYRAICFAKQERYGNAFADIKYCIKKEPYAAVNYDCRSMVYILKQDYKSALADIEKAFSIEPDRISLAFDRAFCLHELGRYAEAMIWYDKYIPYHPEYKETYYNKGLLYEEMDMAEKAAEEFLKAALLGDFNAKDVLKESYPDTYAEYRKKIGSK